MHAGDVFHAWFIFNLHTKISLYLQVMHHNICKMYINFHQNQPLASATKQPRLLTWRASFFARVYEYPSTLVSGLPTTVLLPLGFYPSHPFTPHSSNNIIYIDNINNLGCPSPGQQYLMNTN